MNSFHEIELAICSSMISLMSSVRIVLDRLLAGCAVALFLGLAPCVHAQSGPAFTVLYNFSYSIGGYPGGSYPQGLIIGTDNNFYSVASQGGTGATGTVFQMTPSGTVTTLHDFDAFGPDNSPSNPDGAYPSFPLTLGADGNFYGTTLYGGTTGVGVVFRCSPSGDFSVLHNFTKNGGAQGANDDGEDANTLVQGSDGYLYGTTGGGGANATGTVFRISSNGTFTKIFDFDGIATRFQENNTGAYPGFLVQAPDGNFYGVTNQGGASANGTVFRLTPAGVLTTLYNFPELSDGSSGTNEDGANPGGLTLADDGNFYGFTQKGGAGGAGTLFRIAPAGLLTTLYAFSATDNDGINSDGAIPNAALIQASDGNFYGSAAYGGIGGNGVIFQMTPRGDVTNLHNFESSSDGTNTEGRSPAGVVQGQNGTFYGAAGLGGPSNVGTLFSLNIPLSPRSVVISSSLNASAGVNVQYSYQITATDRPTTFSASGLPDGLTFDNTTGLISGTPTTEGTSTVTLGAANSDSSDTEMLALTVGPVVTVAATVPEITAGTGEIGIFTLTLSQAQGTDLVVYFQLRGTAANGIDYQAEISPKTIKAGKTSKQIKIKPIGAGAGAKRTVVLTLLPSDGYAVGTAGKVKLKIVGQ